MTIATAIRAPARDHGRLRLRRGRRSPSTWPSPHRLGAAVLEILPDWRLFPDPRALRDRVADAGLAIHSAHGCWGGQSIRAPRVDLGDARPGGPRARRSTT